MTDRRKVLDLFYKQKEQLSKRVSEGIEQNRKGNARISLVNQNGQPVPNAQIKVKQKTHEFRFGANLFMLDELETPEKNAAYKSYFADVFNMATLPFYWDALEPVQGMPRYTKDSPRVYRRPSPDLCIEFCEKHGIEPREHALAYEQFFPQWLKEAPVDQVKELLEKRYREISERYAAKIPTIEVTNEMEWDYGKTSFYDEPDYIEWCFRAAEKYFPNNQLVINEHTGLCWMDRGRVTDKYYAYIEANLLKGVRIDAIGLQYHLFNRREAEYANTRLTLNPQSIFRHMDMYSQFGNPLQITEVTIPAYSWKPEDEEIQAELIELLYSIWFSYPNVEQIVYWNLVDGYAHLWDPNPEKIAASQGDMSMGENYYYGGLLRFDLSPKPAYYKIKELIQTAWHTDATMTTDESGSTGFRGFFGNYDVEITVNGKSITKEITLSKNSDNQYLLTI